jgi:hypothetical protein
MKEKRDALERNDLLLLAESLFFTAVLRRSVSLDEARLLLKALGSLARFCDAPAALTQGEHMPAHAALFASLAALLHGKLDESSAGLLVDSLCVLEQAPLRATLRFSLALANQAGPEDQFKSALDAGVFPFLLNVVQHQVRIRSKLSAAA